MSDAIKRWYCACYSPTKPANKDATPCFVVADVVAMVREVMEKHLANKLDGKFPPWEILRRLGEEP